MNLDKIKQKLEALQNAQTNNNSTNNTSGLIWKPSPGKQVVRIVPYLHQKDYPFIELNFYYDFGKTYLSPSTFGHPDPVLEFCEELKRTKGEKEEIRENWRAAKKLEPKFRTYVPVLVRGLEHEGVKFWGFGKTIYTDLLTICDDPDYGDITDLKKGRDITVEYTPAAKDGEFPKTSILVKPNQTVATEDNEVIEKMKQMADLAKSFTEPTYEELKEALKTYLAGKQQQPASTKEEKDFDVAKYNPAKGPTQDEDVVASTTSAFDELFND